ncbi:MAG: hypothetical protein ACRD43_11230 [Pyrinomonadaceae bacterium]
MKPRHAIFTILFLICLAPILALAQNEEVKVPAEVKPFVENGMIPIALETGDLNGDGTKDFILVLSKPTRDDGTYDEAGEALRPTLILTRDAGGKLSLAARNDQVSYCKACGGVMGDPFQGVQIKGMTFTFTNAGGSSDRWDDEYTFGYSRRDKQWQLTRAEENSFSAFSPTKVKTRVRTPPKDFGLIDFKDFDPENFKGKGAK